MKDELKNNALNDDALDAVTGGTGNSGGDEWWTCEDCHTGRWFYKDGSGRLTCRVCGKHNYVMEVIVPITTDD